MMLPSIFGENLLDNWFDDGWNSWDYSNTSLMNTDIKENDNDYELTIFQVLKKKMSQQS